MHINPAIEIYLLDKEGNILAFEAPEKKIKRKRIDLTPVRSFLTGNDMYPILGDDPRSTTRKKVFSAAAYPFQGPVRQYLYVVLGGEDYDSIQNLVRDSYFLQQSITAVIASILLGLAGGLLGFNLITRRLTHLSQNMTAFRQSDFRQLHPYTEDEQPPNKLDEIDQLGQTYDEMAQRIIEQVAALENKDTLRRNLIANVSHDLRTPLASLQGYLETLMLKTGDLPVEQRRQYLDIAYKQSERLTRLIADLFELSKLDARESLPELEPVAVGELLQDVVMKFQLRADTAQIHLSCDFPDELPFVRADIAMLNRVLENLLGNAITHTPPQGTIRLALQAHSEGIEVCIANTGEGISAENIEHVFERFYQAPEQRGGNGAGLGLAIVKRILELHESHIQVKSDKGQETVFSFTLPLWRT